MNNNQKEEIIHYADRCVTNIKKHLEDGNLEYANYWKGKLMGIDFMNKSLKLNIDLDYQLSKAEQLNLILNYILLVQIQATK